jgi:hypothetical protein
MTYNDVTIDTRMEGTIGGGSGAGSGNSTPVAITFTIALSPGAAPVFPGCSINSRNSPQFTGFPAAATSLTSSFEMQYNGCQGFIPPDPNTSTRIEATTLTMNKQ